MTDPPPPLPARIRIVALGDSTTAGTPGWLSPLESPPVGAGDETSQYAWWLMQMHPGWEVVNRGVNGERSDEIHARFARDVLSARAAAVVIIAGVNDIYQGRTVPHVVRELSAMFDAALAASIPVVAGSIIPFNTATPEQNARMNEVNRWIRLRADSTPGMLFVDTRAAVARPDNEDLLADTVDDLHPTAAGYKAMADAICPVLERLLSRLP
jgi:lysophospholipase L1-like esterase